MVIKDLRHLGIRIAFDRNCARITRDVARHYEFEAMGIQDTQKSFEFLQRLAVRIGEKVIVDKVNAYFRGEFDELVRSDRVVKRAAFTTQED